MNLKLIYPKWPKLPNQPEFNLPPIGPVTFAATLPERVNIDFCDENVEPLDLTEKYDLYAISCMLTCQAPRAFAIADEIRASGGTVMLGGIAVMLHAEEAATHADSIFLGEAEGRMEQVLQDFEAGKLKKVYNYLGDFPDTALIGPARRDILKHELYNYRGVQMVDLFSRFTGMPLQLFSLLHAVSWRTPFQTTPD